MAAQHEGMEWKKDALRVIEALETRIDSLERAKREPIAVIGLACRVPGASDSDAFWRLLDQGVDAIGEIPADRFDVEDYYDPDPDAPGKITTRWGGFLDQIGAAFDPQFFGIAPREAVSMDPQQRLLLEVSWEALEHAALAPARLRGSRTGVFVGISSFDYAQLLASQDEATIDAYLGTGVAHSASVGRVSYVLGLEGPNLAIDTACSSSLVAVHQACQSLLAGESDLALAGGVNVILTPTATISLSKARMLAPDGRCKTFDATADGFARGEGCGIVVLKRLADATRDGDRILAVIRGSAVNQDGASSGLTVPNGPAQTRVIRGALEQAGIAPGEVDYLEAHGTGTSLGDPIEVQAAAAALGTGRPADRPLLLGSVKTNIGHLEAAAGDRRPDQSGARAAARADPAASPFPPPESAHPLGGPARAGHARGDRLAQAAADRRRERLRLLRHQRARGAGRRGGAAGGAGGGRDARVRRARAAAVGQE